MEDYESQVRKYSKEEIISVLMGIDKDRFPERYESARRRYAEIKDEPAYSGTDTFKRYHTGERRFWAMTIDGLVIGGSEKKGLS